MEGKALFLYSPLTGRGKIAKKADWICSRLRKTFEVVDARVCLSHDELIKEAKEAAKHYEYLVFAGGDGTFNGVADALLSEKNPPILGYINAGTLGDVGRNFGFGKSVKRSLAVIEKGKTKSIDLGVLNGHAFVYMAAVGAYSDISYAAKSKEKKRIGKFTYYRMAVAAAFKKRLVKGNLLVDGKDIPFEAPFLMILNGRNVGGFPVNKGSEMNDGKMELFLTKKGIFNGLPHYLFEKKRMKSVFCEKIEITLHNGDFWCLDGEKGPSGNVKIEIAKQKLRVFCAK